RVAGSRRVYGLLHGGGVGAEVDRGAGVPRGRAGQGWHRGFVGSQIDRAVLNAGVAIQVGGEADGIVIAAVDGWGAGLQPVIAGGGWRGAGGNGARKQRVGGDDARTGGEGKA